MLSPDFLIKKKKKRIKELKWKEENTNSCESVIKYINRYKFVQMIMIEIEEL